MGNIKCMDLTFVDTNLKIINDFNGAIDFVTKEIRTRYVNANFYYIDGMIDTRQFELTVLQPLVNQNQPFPKTLSGLKSMIYTACIVLETKDIEEAVKRISAGDVVLLLDGCEDLLIFALRKANSRTVTEPPTSSVIKGPREGFTEDIKTNMLMLRRKVRSNKLLFETITMGRYSKTSIVFAYIKGIASPDVINKVKEKLQKYEVDGIVDSSNISKMIEPYPYSLFKQVANTEKPDVLASKLLDGRVAILVDGSPIVLTVPFLLVEDFEDSADFYKRTSRVNFLRAMRVLAAFFALILPGFFVSIQLHQYQIIPLQLLIAILNATVGLPFSPTMEMIVALLLFEILGEASIRMPRHIGMALSVVGALVLGETAVKAGLLSSITVLTVALSGIGIFAVPDEVGTLSQLRFLFVIIGGLLGAYGILLASWAILAYLCALDSFSVPYLSPFSPIVNRDMQEVLIKRAFQNRTKRTSVLGIFNKTRVKRHRKGVNE